MDARGVEEMAGCSKDAFCKPESVTFANPFI